MAERIIYAFTLGAIVACACAAGVDYGATIRQWQQMGRRTAIRRNTATPTNRHHNNQRFP